MAEQTAEYVCPRCGAVSHNPTDQAEGYCGRCHDWTGTKTTPAKRAIVHLGLEDDLQFQHEFLTNAYLHAAVTALGYALEQNDRSEVG